MEILCGKRLHLVPNAQEGVVKTRTIRREVCGRIATRVKATTKVGRFSFQEAPTKTTFELLFTMDYTKHNLLNHTQSTF